jgi:hypothetical protein
MTPPYQPDPRSGQRQTRSQPYDLQQTHQWQQPYYPGHLVPRQATFARSESSLADAITRFSVSSPTAYRRVMRSRERRGRCVGRFLVGR